MGSGTGGFGHYCMCTIIAPDVALTAAHCYYAEYTVGDYVEIGKYYVDKDNRRNGKVSQFKIIDAIRHTKWNPDYDRSQYDIMVLKLDGKVTTSPVTLQFTKQKRSTKDKFTVVGWGSTNPEIKTVSDTLQNVEVTYIHFNKCQAWWKREWQLPSLKSYFCAYSTDKDSCYGDSGGPIFIKRKKNNSNKSKKVKRIDNDEYDYIQAGFVSFGTTPCAKYPGGAYSDLSDKSMNKFIHTSVCHKKKGLAPYSPNCYRG